MRHDHENERKVRRLKRGYQKERVYKEQNTSIPRFNKIPRYINLDTVQITSIPKL